MTRVLAISPLPTRWVYRHMTQTVKTCLLSPKSCAKPLAVICGVPISRYQQQSRPPCCYNHPHPDGPTHMTMNQLLDAQLKLEQAHQQRDISKRFKGTVANMHCLTKFSEEAVLTPYMGHAYYLYACYLKSQVSSRSSPSECNLESVWSC